jgi:hypothetical protein
MLIIFVIQQEEIQILKFKVSIFIFHLQQIKVSLITELLELNIVIVQLDP